MLIKLKDLGGLKYPSDLDICESAEKVIRTYQNNIFTTTTLIEKMTIDAFNVLQDYSQDPSKSFCKDHEKMLIKLILAKFYGLRIHHECYLLLNEEDQCRMLNNKLTLFRHQ